MCTLQKCTSPTFVLPSSLLRLQLQQKEKSLQGILQLSEVPTKQAPSVHLHAVGTPAAAKFVDVTVNDYTAQLNVNSDAEDLLYPATSLSCLPSSINSTVHSPTTENSRYAKLGIVSGMTLAARKNKLPVPIDNPVSHCASFRTSSIVRHESSEIS